MKRLIPLLAIAGLLAFTASANADLTKYEANEDWSLGQFAGDVTWTECTASYCSWIPFIVTVPIESPRCDGSELLDSQRDDRNIVWNGGGRNQNGTVPIEVTDAPIRRGGYGQRACLGVQYSVMERNPICEAQAPIFGEDPNDCPLEVQYRHRLIQSVAMAVAKPDPEPDPEPEPSMTLVEAKILAKGKLAKKYGKSWRRGKAKKVTCQELTTIFNCKATWKFKAKKRKGSVTVKK